MKIFRPYLVATLLAALAMPTVAAEWKECERAKLRQLNLEQRASANGHKSRKAGGGKSSGGRRNAEKIDEWLWKNCRSYASELRSLEQSRM